MKPIILVIIGLFLLISVPTYANADAILSPVEQKYKTNNSALFEKYLSAKALLNLPGRHPENLEQANAELTEILEINLNFAPAYVAYAQLSLEIGYITGQVMGHDSGPGYSKDSKTRAETAVLQALKLEPTYADAYALLGYIYQKMYLYREAKLALQNADRLGSKSPWLYLYNATLLEAEKKWEAAGLLFQVVLDTAITDRPAYHFALYEYANTFRFSGDYETADVFYQQAIEYEPTASHLNSYCSFLIFQMADFKKAVEVGERSLALSPSDYTKEILGMALYARWAEVSRSLDDGEAPAMFDRANELFPEILTAMDRLGKHPNTRSVSYIVAEKVDEIIAQSKKEGKKM
ncbi:MAG: hypothetical protein V7723_07465 [Sneathiella sp.]|uniref:tetratricopeptide repeat protein n=1 Tax=Sneathiella sp. TaxID=1964365 RepID=UPI00300179CE